jgi:hypothetical protein
MTDTDNLVKRLWESDEASILTNQAARRIEALEAELRETQDRANAFAEKEYYTEIRAEKAEAERDALADDLDAMRRTITPIYKLREERAAEKARADGLAEKLERVVGLAKQAVDVIHVTQTYQQPDDPWVENALTMCEHEVFDFDVDSFRANLAEI